MMKMMFGGSAANAGAATTTAKRVARRGLSTGRSYL
jgi:hypothetical protein